jgi:uncharacterized cupredoxin-like copper-binding protein
MDRATGVLTLLGAFASVLVLGIVAIVAVATRSESTKAASTTVQVHLSEFTITLTPSTVPSGEVRFISHNGGNVDHNFAVPALNLRTRNLKPGETAELVAADVPTGPLGVLCEVAGHEAAGMKAVLTVVDGAAPVEASTGEMAAMTWQEMDAMMEKVAMKFPEATSGTGNGEFAPTVAADGTKTFAITASVIDWEVEAGKFVDGWAYNGQIPGPIIRVNVGDKVRIVLTNELPESTSLHLHGIRVPNASDGVDPYTQPAIEPGATYTYEFTALEPSIGMYHSHHNAQVQVPNGLAGALLIGDWRATAMAAAGDRVADTDGAAEQEVVMVLNDAGTIGLSLNGKSFPATSPYQMKVGESMVVHYFNEGNMTHPMHLHQPSGLVIAHDGKVLEAPFWADTISVAPGERWTVVYTAQDRGVWAWHCHILTHAETPTGMRYMVTALIVS